MKVYILRQKKTNCLDGRWGPVGTVAGYDNLSAARMAAEEIELQTGHRVGIDSVDETGKVKCVYGPEWEQA